MENSISIILGAACILGGIAYLIKQRIKRVRKMQRDFRAKSAFLTEVPYDTLGVFNGKRCLYSSGNGRLEK